MSDNNNYKSLLLQTNGNYWNWKTIPAYTLSPDANDTYHITYSYINSLADIAHYNFSPPSGNYQTFVADYYTNFLAAPNSGLKGTIENILNPVGSYSVLFSDVANIEFDVPTSGRGMIDIGIGSSGDPNTIVDFEISNPSYNPYFHGDIWLTSDFQGTQSAGTQLYKSIVHEIGHALGLEHSFEGQPPLAGAENTYQYTVMAYDPMPGMIAVAPAGLQLYDIAAIQELYGINYDTRSGNTTYSAATAFASARPNNAFIYTIWDGGGTDTIDASSYTDGVKIDLREGHFSSIGKSAESNYDGERGVGLADNNVAIAYHAVIENVKGTAKNDVLIANEAVNNIEGGDGNDFIYGNSHLVEGSGLNVLDGDTLNGGNGIDTVDYSNYETNTVATGNGYGYGSGDGYGWGWGSGWDVDWNRQEWQASWNALYPNGIEIGIDANLASNTVYNNIGVLGPNDTLVSIENVVGSDGMDYLNGSSGNNSFDGRDGINYFQASEGGVATFIWGQDQDLGYFYEIQTDDVVQLKDFTTDQLRAVYVEDKYVKNGGHYFVWIDQGYIPNWNQVTAKSMWIHEIDVNIYGFAGD